MGSSRTKVRTIRIKNETAEYFADKPLNKVVESVHDLAIKREIEIEKGEVRVIGNGIHDVHSSNA